MTPNNDTTTQTIPSGADTAQAVNHLEAFKAFAQAKPYDKSINHHDGFESCAIGAYGKSINLHDDNELRGLFYDIKGQLVEQTAIPYIAKIIDNPMAANRYIPTYGKLFDFLCDPVPVFQEANNRYDWDYMIGIDSIA